MDNLTDNLISYLPRVLDPKFDSIYSITCHTCRNDQSLTKALEVSPYSSIPASGGSGEWVDIGQPSNFQGSPRKMIIADPVIMHERRAKVFTRRSSHHQIL
ncbi:hypothetical protein VN97_g1949 [Penicillium thymicola]|uniref:Uncharacterized protein n=1 Tax=Penicillium thymicola TaxID=293382 RepID=A0AAI9TQ23_PENTH|nr:hypothetical protein VN97_g1949 [Penicillium thymicola]